MSSITRILTRRAVVIPRATTAAAAIFSTRHFTTSLVTQKTLTESAKDGLKTVDRAVSDKLVDGFDAATAAKEKLKETADKVSNSDAAHKAEQLKNEAAGKANELKNEASGKASEIKGEVKGKAKEAEGKAKGTAEEVKRKM